jgi:hypothetical protein
LQLIPVLACARLPLATRAECAQFRCNVSPLDATLPCPLLCVANKGFAEILKSLRCNTYKKHRGWGCYG